MPYRCRICKAILRTKECPNCDFDRELKEKQVELGKFKGSQT